MWSSSKSLLGRFGAGLRCLQCILGQTVEQTSPTNALQVIGVTRKPVWGQKLAQICCYLFSKQALLQGEFPLHTRSWLPGRWGRAEEKTSHRERERHHGKPQACRSKARPCFRSDFCHEGWSKPESNTTQSTTRLQQPPSSPCLWWHLSILGILSASGDVT